MTEQELREEIANIIYHTGCTGACCECDYSKVSDADTYCKALLKADALIAKGLRFGNNHRIFVENAPIPKTFTNDTFFIMPNTPPTIKQLYGDEEVEQIVKERDEYKYRAEVAEKAVYDAEEDIWLRGGAPKEIARKYSANGARERLKKAEKELQEEKQDENL